MRGFVVVALGAILIWIGLSTEGSKVDAADVAEVRADEPLVDVDAPLGFGNGAAPGRGASVEAAAPGPSTPEPAIGTEPEAEVIETVMADPPVPVDPPPALQRTFH